jgi:hypothetical protein
LVVTRKRLIRSTWIGHGLVASDMAETRRKGKKIGLGLLLAFLYHITILVRNGDRVHFFFFEGNRVHEYSTMKTHEHTSHYSMLAKGLESYMHALHA